MKRLSAKLAVIGSSLAILPFIAHAQFGDALKNVGDVAGSGGYDVSGGDNQLLATIGSIVSKVIGLTGIIFVLFTIYAGFLWMTAGGDTEKVTMAKTIIRNCVIGIVIVSLAYAITSFVFSKLLAV